MYEGRPCMIPTVNVQTSVPTLSALQLVKGVKKGEETFVAKLCLDMQPSLGQRNPGLLGSAASTRSNATAGLGSFRAC
ncbi:hypothetical protein Tco_0284515, partial [Tanacetum coccineum]